MLLTNLAKNRLKKQQAPQSYAQYADDPVGFIEKVLGEFLTKQQKAIALSVLHNQETNCMAAHGVGKSHLASRLVAWWCLAVGGMCITTAPTRRQVESIIWSSVRKLWIENKFPGELGRTFVRLTPTAHAFGFTASHTSSSAFQGIHASEGLLVLIDESSGISSEIDDAAGSCTVGSLDRLLRIGNPIVTGTPFEKACARSNQRIDVWNHPNTEFAYYLCTDGIHRLKPEVAAAILDEKGNVLPQSQWADWCPSDRIPGAVSIGWIEKARKEKGEGSAYWQSRVEAVFPTDSEASITPRTWFLAARARYDANPAYWDNHASPHQWRHALDVGDGGDDHAIASWRGSVLYSVRATPTKGDRMDVTRAAGIASKVLLDYPGIMSVDRIGVGAGALAILKEQELNCLGTEWGSAASDNVQFLNAKAEQHWLLREALQNEEVAIAPLGEYEEYAMEDLALTYYEYTSTGKVRIEDKAKTRKRLHRSPNCFVAGTMILTTKGDRPIESLSTDDFVITPYGERQVLKLWRSSANLLTTAKFSNGSQLIGKGEHKVFTWDRGWCRLDALILNNSIESSSIYRLLLWRLLNLLLTKGKSSGFRKQVDTIAQGGKVKRRDFFTEGYGKTPMEISQRGMMFTTLTGIARIIHLKTWEYLKEVFTVPGTRWRSIKIPNIPKLTINTFKRLGLYLSNGIAQRKGESGTLNTGKKPGETDHYTPEFAMPVGKNFLPISQTEQTFAAVLVGKEIATIQDLKLIEIASIAVKNLLHFLTETNNVVPVSVQTDSDMHKRTQVYNLTVDEDNVYYANGILVSNCGDAIVMAYNVSFGSDWGEAIVTGSRRVSSTIDW